MLDLARRCTLPRLGGRRLGTGRASGGRRGGIVHVGFGVSQARSLLDAVQKRLTLFVYPSMVLLVASGLLLARHSPAPPWGVAAGTV